MPRFVSSRRPLRALIALTTALVLAPLAFATTAASANTPASAAQTTQLAQAANTAQTTIRPTETYAWAEVYFGNGEIAQGQTLQVTVSDLLTGRVITANLGDGAIVVPDIPAADHYGDTGFSVDVPADFPVGVHNLTIATDAFDPIVIPITVVAGDAPAETTEPAEPETTEPAAPSEGTATEGSAAADAADPTTSEPGASQNSFVDPPIPAAALIGVIGGVAVLIIITAIVRRTRNKNA